MKICLWSSFIYDYIYDSLFRPIIYIAYPERKRRYCPHDVHLFGGRSYTPSFCLMENKDEKLQKS